MKVTINSITSGYLPIPLVNNNFTVLANAFENTLSRDGASPNTMLSDLDMNGFRLLNALAEGGDGFIYENNWATETVYEVNNLVYVAIGTGSSYDGFSLIAKKNHTSSVLNTDFSNGDWGILAARGANGSGSGDLISTNNLSDVSNATTARSNLGAAKSGSNTDITSLSAPALGAATATTQSQGDGTTKVATTAYVDTALSSVGGVATGIVVDYAGSSAPTGYLACDGSAISRSTYSALFTAISTAWGIGDGSTTFNLPNLNGRATIGSGTGTNAVTVAAASVTTATDLFTITTNTAKWITGMPVILTTTGTLPSGLSLATTYYIVRNSATTIKFATTLANAQNGVVIDITTQGTGNHTVTQTLTARTVGETGGEETHAGTSVETLAHTHTSYQSGGGTGGSVGVNDGIGYATQSPIATSSFGGNVAMNNMQPYATMLKVIKT